MGVTEWVNKQTPHFGAVVVLGIAAFCGPFGTVFGVECKAMAKDRTITNPWFELGGALGLAFGAGATGLFLWMNQSWGKHMQEKDERWRESRKRETDTMLARTQGSDPEGHLK